MKIKLLAYCLILLAALLLEIGVLSRFFGGFYLSIIVPLVFFGFLLFPFKQILVAAAIAGLVLDMSYLSRSITFVVFLMLELILLSILSKVVVNLRSGIGVFLALVVLTWVFSLTRLILDHGVALSPQLLFVALAGLIWSSLFYLIYHLLNKAGIWQKE